ncbi:succinylglutamate desuccinylase/aspartoacylase family protein [Sciscionella sediminilitoris]|uniref:succinylglutamate desuccinylase/aspartoacylase family protein n=1 Tax=Sciscionella sediminilitoris TaxID=1445613 RepID=UPI0004DFC73B|nr:succinylglutamate desuccinylase/aspartoacylase family protein [Sciscionella sp. SE31]
MTTFEHRGLKVPAGSRAHGVLGEVPQASGSAITVPYLVVNGAEDGPVFVVIAGSHGNEVVGTGAAIEFARSIDPRELSGTVIAVPAVNVPAVSGGVYVSPIDGINMSGPHYWDAEEEGSTSRRLGAIVGSVLERAEFVVDVHGNNEPCAPMSMLFLENARDAETAEVAVRMAEAFGVTPVDMSAPTAHPAWLGPSDVYPAATALARGIPGLMVELNGARTLVDAGRGAQGLTAILTEIGMLPGVGERHADDARIPGGFGYWGALSASAAGLVWVRHPAGVPFHTGDLLLEITDLYGEVLEEIRSPVDGFCWWYPGASYGQCTHAIPAGSTVALLAERR